MGESSDISLKYQRLAAEYSKVRAQVAVLKKAISEEQGRNIEFKEALKGKDQTIRKLEQEVECLNFRNVQLMKRVSILQSDYEGMPEKLSKNKHKQPIPALDEDVLNSELRNKIEENEKLYIQVTSAEIEHKRIVDDLTSQLEQLKSERLSETKELNDIITKNKETIEKLTKERAKLEVELKHYEKEVKEVRIQEETCQEDLKTVETELQRKLKLAEHTVREKLPFNDTSSTSTNGINVPVISNKQLLRFNVVMEEMYGLVSDLIRSFHELHKSMEERIKLVDHNTLNNGLLRRFKCHLTEGSPYLTNIGKKYILVTKKILEEQMFLIKGSNLTDLAKSFSKYVRYIEKLLPYILLSLRAENNIKGSISKLEEIHNKLNNLVLRLIACFTSMENCLQLFIIIEKSEYALHPSALVRRIFQIFCNLQTSFEEIKKTFSAKMMTEQNLPIVTVEIKAADSSILTSVISIINGIKRINQKMADNMEILCDGIPCKSRGFLGTIHSNSRKFQFQPVVLEFKERGSGYINRVQLEPQKTIPYEIAVENNETLEKYADNKDSLVKQLSTTNEKLQKAEQEKEHWMLEYQLLQMKHGKMVDGFENTTDNEDIHVLFKAKKNQMLSEQQIADSKAVAFHTENMFLNQKINLAKQAVQKLEAKYADSQYAQNQLQDELKTKVEMYEDQLRTMSDHLAELNHKITTKSEEVEALKYMQAGKKVKSK